MGGSKRTGMFDKRFNGRRVQKDRSAISWQWTGFDLNGKKKYEEA